MNKRRRMQAKRIVSCRSPVLPQRTGNGRGLRAPSPGARPGAAGPLFAVGLWAARGHRGLRPDVGTALPAEASESLSQGLGRFARSPRLSQASQPRSDSGAGPEQPLPCITEDEEEADEVFQRSPAAVAPREPLLPPRSSPARLPGAPRGEERGSPTARPRGEAGGGGGRRSARLLGPSLHAPGPPELSPRVVDGIEDDGGTREARTFCFSAAPRLQGASRGSQPPGTAERGPALAAEVEAAERSIMRLSREVRGRPGVRVSPAPSGLTAFRPRCRSPTSTARFRSSAGSCSACWSCSRAARRPPRQERKWWTGPEAERVKAEVRAGACETHPRRGAALRAARLPESPPGWGRRCAVGTGRGLAGAGRLCAAPVSRPRA
ncbi:potassium voltage-gated channel subfamily H member 4-like [Numida meleagris]|uniref:potassium voltage-gated channel subfamily H member 4-like n=1 Tax=Numida meleagris TaxID=8996 RepID=UPI000B3DB5F9|nr:potassium voltage-gated channel subfamily H member 4-like [Numida meleagris]